jgi:SAM-dependent methyltransferase
MYCPLCETEGSEFIDLNISTTFTHLDFSDFDEGGQIVKCLNCQSLRNAKAFMGASPIESLYKRPEYAYSRQTAQTFIVDGESEPVTRSYLQAKLISPYLKGSPNVLDIGCFDGKLLVEISRNFPEGQFRGFDINESLLEVFPKLPNFHLWVADPEEITGEYDLVCLSHSILYLADLAGLFKMIRSLLKPKGLLFIQAPNMVLNPYQLLLSDQYHYFSPASMENALHLSGFDADFIDYGCFPRDLIIVAKQNEAPKKRPMSSDESAYQSVQVINATRNKLNALPSDIELSVLGTTVTAAFVDSILGQRNINFVDENTNSAHNTFRDKPIISPQSMDKRTHLILPYGKSNINIQNRFVDQYDFANFVLL